MAENQNNSTNSDQSQHLRQFLGAENRYSDLTNAVADGVAQAFREASNPRDPRNSSQSFFNDVRNNMQFSRNSTMRRKSDYKRTGRFLDDFEQGITDQLLDSITGGDFKKSMNKALSVFATEFGVEFKDFPHELGKEVSKKLFGDIRNSPAGKSIEYSLKKNATKFLNHLFDGKGADASAAKDAILKIGQSLFSNGASAASTAASGASAGMEVASGSMSAASTLVAGDAAAGSAMAGVADLVITAAPYLIIIVAALAVLGPALKGLGDMVGALGKSFSREQDMMRKRMENAQARLKADMEYLAKEPFEILTAAAKEWESTWDSTLSKVALTQGYTKEDVYDLYSSISERLISEGLGSVIPATDVINKLSNILDSGLSGKIAEEFAYEAVKLTAAIPTQDFTQYASTYAELASEAVNLGYDQASAIEYANSQLEQFASNLLYSSRNLTGGFTTGLQNASSLFSDAVAIAQSAKTGNAAAISGTLTSVSAIIGSVAPDLAQGLVQNIVSAAVGGNSDTIVALRSLAGVNAGNTEFLRLLAEDPQGIFVSLFRNLANMQTMSPSNYMEVAEGLSSVFGIDMQAFARVDFNNLANKIAEMNVNSNTLDENMSLLASGEATTSSEQLKLQEINNVILEEGLAYVIDSEAGRMIQEHMWQEQIANELENATYAVDLQGSALSYLEGIRETAINLLSFLNPVTLISNGIHNMVATVQEVAEINDDLREILELGAVGSNQTAFSNLVTTGQDLGLVSSLVEMMGGTAGLSRTGLGRAANWISNVVDSFSQYSVASVESRLYNAIATGNTPLGWLSNLANTTSGSSNSSIASRYSGFNIGKSEYGTLLATSSPVAASAISRSIASNATANALAESNRHFQAFLDSAEEASKSMSYEDWLASARDYGVADYYQALSNYGKSEEQIRSYFEANQARQGALIEQARKEDEQKFRDENRKFWDYDAGSSGIFQTAMWLPFLNDNFKPFFDPGARFDTRLNAIDMALSDINIRLESLNERIGDSTSGTVIGILSEINKNVQITFVEQTSQFQQCLADWVAYISSKKAYSDEIKASQAWSELQRAEGDQKEETLLALANALNSFSADELQKLDPQLQTNALLGKIVIILEAIMQQNNTQAGGLSLIDTMSALGLGITGPAS